MKQLLSEVDRELMQDDLLIRVTSGLCGGVVTLVGLLLLYGFTTRGVDRLPGGWPLAVAFVVLALVFGIPLILRSVLSTRTPLGRFLACHATPGALRRPDDFTLWIMLPALALTVMLRRVGVSGEAEAE
ncbi:MULTISPECIES: hypothetical protein [unclassified Bradyrhizobium]|uniref:hypothetical protein n=1 Tax=unclassified Bradyrhizobium TaxID=2631580 RepID=UPI002915D6D8|nr:MULTISPECIES: hypothetical protein [unclassified Bradyrhizobium]